MSPVAVETTGRPAAKASSTDTGLIVDDRGVEEDVRLGVEVRHRRRRHRPREADAVTGDRRREPAELLPLAPIPGHRQRRLRVASLHERERLDRDVHAIVGVEVA